MFANVRWHLPTECGDTVQHFVQHHAKIQSTVYECPIPETISGAMYSTVPTNELNLPAFRAVRSPAQALATRRACAVWIRRRRQPCHRLPWPQPHRPPARSRSALSASSFSFSAAACAASFSACNSASSRSRSFLSACFCDTPTTIAFWPLPC